MSVDHTVASAIVDSQKKWKRKPADFYPTPTAATIALIRFLRLDKGTFIREPACGDGAMAAVFEQEGMSVLASDIRDSGYGIPHIDFLNDPPLDEGYAGVTADSRWLITNPPFSIAPAFIEKALTEYPNVAMLLKAQYWHAASRLDFFNKHKPTWVLPLTWRPAFLESERGGSPLMDVIWVVWHRDNKRSPRPSVYQPIPRPKDFSEPPDWFDILAASL